MHGSQECEMESLGEMNTRHTVNDSTEKEGPTEVGDRNGGIPTACHVGGDTCVLSRTLCCHLTDQQGPIA